MKKSMWITILIYSLPVFVFAQQPVVITSADVPSTDGTIFEKKVFKGDSISINLGSAGENQVWDFTELNLPITETWAVISKENSPFSSDFSEANLVYQVTVSNNDTVTYNYVKLTDTDLSELGQGKKKGDETTMLVTPLQSDAKTNFPVTYGDAPWISIPQYESNDVEYEFGGFKIEVDIIAHDSSYYMIDGWGTIKTPLGDISCLRVKQYHVLDVYIKDLKIWIYEFEKDIIYSWVAPKYGFVATVKSTLGQTNENFEWAREVTVLSGFSSVPVEDTELSTMATEYILFQNFPNPFNPITTIRYELPKSEFVKLKIFNAQGEEVTTLIDEKQQSGKYYIQWNAANHASGLYFYQIQTDNMTMRKKCLFVK